jgi:lysine-N-methylase
MSLPIVVLPNEEKWDCHRCGICCRGSIIPLSDQDLAKLRSQKWEEHPEYRHTPIYVRHRDSSKPYQLAKRSDGACVFLDEQGLCRIQSEFGCDAKPTVCRVFPLQLIPRDKQVVLTTRRACPSSAADLGQSLQGHLPLIKQLVREGSLSAESIAAPALKAGERRDWKMIHVALETIARLLNDQRYPPVRRLVHALQFANLLERARTKRMDDQKLAELIHTLEEVVVEESKFVFAERRPPKWYARVFFRQMAVECARLHPQFQPRSSWSERLNLTRTALRVARGRGPTPFLHPPFPSSSFADLEKPLGPVLPAIDSPLTRLIESSSASYLYALADRRGWSVIDSLRGLSVLFPVGLWLLRWVSYGREPQVQDMVNIVVALDRSQGYRSLAGSIHRGRLTILSASGELERLVAWYAQ